MQRDTHPTFPNLLAAPQARGGTDSIIYCFAESDGVETMRLEYAREISGPTRHHRQNGIVHPPVVAFPFPSIILERPWRVQPFALVALYRVHVGADSRYRPPGNIVSPRHSSRQLLVS